MVRIIKRVIKNNSNGQLLITIPKNSHLREHDFVELLKVPRPVKNEKGGYTWKKE